MRPDAIRAVAARAPKPPAAQLRGYARKRQMGIANVRFNAAGCLDRCEFGPNSGDLSRVVPPRSQADIDEILRTHLKNGGGSTA